MDQTWLINRILEVERSARALSDEALERQAHMDEALAAEKAAILEKYMTQAKQRLEKLAQTEQEKMERTLRAQDERLAQANRKMEYTYSRYGDNWVDTMFHQVVDGQ